jgi:hypothetical protein
VKNGWDIKGILFYTDRDREMRRKRRRGGEREIDRKSKRAIKREGNRWKE